MVTVSALRSMKKSNELDDEPEEILQTTFTLCEFLLNNTDLPYDILCNFGLAVVMIIDMKSTGEWVKVSKVISLYMKHFKDFL